MPRQTLAERVPNVVQSSPARASVDTDGPETGTIIVDGEPMKYWMPDNKPIEGFDYGSGEDDAEEIPF